MEHSELVAEMSQVEHLSTQERLHLARRRRLQQLKVWSLREKEWLRQIAREHPREKPSKRGIYFSDNVMLLEAAGRNDIDEVRRLLMKGVSPDSTNEDGLTALHQCCIDDNEEMMKLLIEYGANVNAEDSEKWTPLHAAATCGHLHLVRYLISRGANLLAVNADGNMPYDICEDEVALDYIEGEMARCGVTQELIDETRASTESQMLYDLKQAVAVDADIETPDHQGATPLHIAAANGYIRVVEFLLDHHVSTDVKDVDDWTPVHAAACWGHLEVLEVLCQHGADLNAKTKHDETPADICEDPELRERIVQLRSEQETKKMQDARNKKVKRSQSNTRTQSVRRTSIRDKSLTTKKDTVEEARLRLQARDVFAAPEDGERKGVPLHKAENGEFSNKPETVNDDPSSNGVLDLVSVRKAPEGKDDSDNHSATFSNDTKNSALEIPAETSYVSEGNGKININVTVTINAGTLADLKKQRSQIRNNSPDGSIFSHPPSVGTESDPVASPPPTVHRFSGNTADVVGDPRTRRCCVIS